MKSGNKMQMYTKKHFWGNIWWVGHFWADWILVPCRPKYLRQGKLFKMKSGIKMQNDTTLHLWGNGLGGFKKQSHAPNTAERKKIFLSQNIKI